jgi:hypothetical protein
MLFPENAYAASPWPEMLGHFKQGPTRCAPDMPYRDCDPMGVSGKWLSRKGAITLNEPFPILP